MIKNEETLRNTAIIRKLHWYKASNFETFVLFNNLYGNTTFYNGLIIDVRGDEFTINDKKYGESIVEYHDIVKLDISRSKDNKPIKTEYKGRGGKYRN